ncbi:MAG: hypothetical protein WBB67_14315 [bacterium]
MFTEIFGRNDYYQIGKSKGYTQGRIAWAIVFFTPARSELKRLLLDDSGEHIGFDDIDKEAFTEHSHGPFKTPFKLEINEEILLVTAKKRPVILLQSAEEGDIWKVIQKDRALDARLKLSKIWLVLPLNTYRNLNFKTLVEHLYFPIFFPFVSNGACPEEDSWGRFDRTQMTHMTLIEPTEYLIKSEMLQVINENFISYIMNQEHGVLYPDFRVACINELRKKKIVK